MLSWGVQEGKHLLKANILMHNMYVYVPEQMISLIIFTTPNKINRIHDK